MSYVYIESKPGLYTVGFYDENGEWQPESDHETPESAANRVIVLNGGTVTPSMKLADTEQLMRIAWDNLDDCETYGQAGIICALLAIANELKRANDVGRNGGVEWATD